METYHNRYVIRSVDENTKILRSVWLPETEKMDDDEFQSEMLRLADWLVKYQIKYLLTFTKDMNFVITPDLQLWIAEKIVPQFIKANVLKHAIINSEELIVRLSVEQTLGDVEEHKHEHQTHFFSTEEKALNWFFYDKFV